VGLKSLPKQGIHIFRVCCYSWRELHRDRSRAPDCDCKKQRHERTNVRLQTSRQVESRHPGDPGDLADTADPGEMAQNLKRLSMILYHVLSTLQLR